MERAAMLGPRWTFNAGWFNRWGVTSRRAWVADLRRGLGAVWAARRLATPMGSCVIRETRTRAVCGPLTCS
eukprot:scaffold59771_cov58-Phaeocystis_antarctica.AAC.3